MKKLLFLLLIVPLLSIGQTTHPINPGAGSITSGTIDGAVIGGTNPAAGTFTSLAATTVNGNTLTTGTGTLTLGAGKTTTFNHTSTFTTTDAQTYTFPATSSILARTDAGQTFTGTQAFGDVTTTTLSSTQGLTLPTVENAITAFAGGGQGSATALSSTATFHRITTVVTSADSVKLPTAVAGAMHYIRNDSTSGNGTQVYGTSPDTINGAATATGVPLSNGVGAWFISTANGAWTTATSGTGATGSGNVVRATSPSLTTPNIGAATGTSLAVAGPLSTTASGTGSAIKVAPGTTGSKFLYMGSTPGDNASGIMFFEASSSTTNWKVGTNIVTGGAFEFIPSTAGGGTTYTTPVLTLNPTSAAITGTLTVSAIASSGAAQSGYLCYNTSGGVITYDGGATCLISLEEYKNNHGPITGKDAISDVMALRPFWGTYKTDSIIHDSHEQPFLGARQVESVDKRLAAYSEDGELRSVRYQNLTAVLVSAIQDQQAQIAQLRFILFFLSMATLSAFAAMYFVRRK